MLIKQSLAYSETLSDFKTSHPSLTKEQASIFEILRNPVNHWYVTFEVLDLILFVGIVVFKLRTQCTDPGIIDPLRYDLLECDSNQKNYETFLEFDSEEMDDFMENPLLKNMKFYSKGRDCKTCS